MASGKLSSEVVQAIFKSVKNEPSMQDLVPYLKEPPQIETTGEANLNAIKNQNNENEVKQAENLIKQAMKAISSIVEANSRAQACQPLRPDLQEFYNLILRTRQEQDIERVKRALNRKTAKRNNFSQDIRLLDPSKIKEKTSTVKKLLREYDLCPHKSNKIWLTAILNFFHI
ncbi:hypothetical protein DOY81_013805 [Sarcophaga bullata]|nr:hypothetical protein DOY81_013805 [Sarcophaga bullata]